MKNKIVTFGEIMLRLSPENNARFTQCNAFATKIPNTTKIIISQRISSVQDADRIIVLDNGMVSGFDTHENLLKNNTIYKEIYDVQMSGGGDFDEKMN